MGQGLRQSIAGYKQCMDPIHVVSRSMWVPDSQVLTCSEVTILTTGSYLNRLISLIQVFLFSLCCDWKSFTTCVQPYFPLSGMQVEIQFLKIGLMGEKITGVMPANERYINLRMQTYRRKEL